MDNFMLYHGSYCEVHSPDLTRCAGFKDFGRGFYLTTSIEQARSFSRTSLRKAVRNGVITEEQEFSIVSAFKCNAESLRRLNVYSFKDADMEWLLCVAGHRKSRSFPKVVERYRRFDVIIGKIANDATNATITAYMAGAYGDPAGERAAQICVSLLLPDRLKDQYCFRTNPALECLTFQGSERLDDKADALSS